MRSLALFMAVLMLAGCKQDTQVTSATPSCYLSDFYEKSLKVWPNNQTLTIAFHGHSVPAGYFKDGRVQTFDSYPYLLHLALNQMFPYAVINVVVTAIGGENSRSGAERFERDVLPLKPDIVAIDYAINDRGIGLKKARKAWVSMIESAQDYGAKVILLTPTPDMAFNLTDPQSPMNQHARQIRELSREYNVALVDSQQAFIDEVNKGRALDSFMSQSNHPNRRGHELVARALLKWFEACRH